MVRHGQSQDMVRTANRLQPGQDVDAVGRDHAERVGRQIEVHGLAIEAEPDQRRRDGHMDQRRRRACHIGTVESVLV